MALTIRSGAADQETAILEFVDIQKAERIRYDVLHFRRDWTENARMFKDYRQTIFPQNISPALSSLTSHPAPQAHNPHTQ